MNADNRKKLNEIISEIEHLLGQVTDMKDDEQSKYDNMPEGLQDGEKGERMSEAINELETAEVALEEAKSAIENAAQ